MHMHVAHMNAYGRGPGRPRGCLNMPTSSLQFTSNARSAQAGGASCQAEGRGLRGVRLAAPWAPPRRTRETYLAVSPSSSSGNRMVFAHFWPRAKTQVDEGCVCEAKHKGNAHVGDLHHVSSSSSPTHAVRSLRRYPHSRGLCGTRVLRHANDEPPRHGNHD